jgi:hypothetical protein
MEAVQQTHPEWVPFDRGVFLVSLAQAKRLLRALNEDRAGAG